MKRRAEGQKGWDKGPRWDMGRWGGRPQTVQGSISQEDMRGQEGAAWPPEQVGGHLVGSCLHTQLWAEGAAFELNAFILHRNTKR